jgi:hypothetical protein
VPGSCGGWLEALSRYGTMDAATVFGPAVEYAEQGFALTVKNNAFFSSAAPALSLFSSSTDAYLPGGRAPRPGDILVQADLGCTFRQVAEAGPEVFYQGEIADKIVAYMQETDGLITHEDLQNFAPVWLDPVHIDYRGYKVYAPAPPCQAVQYLETLNIMEGFDVGALGHNTVETLHRFIEAAKLATADRAEYTAIQDPPTQGLLSKDFAAQRRALIGECAQPSGGALYTATKVPSEVVAGDPYTWMKTECTTHFDAIDAQGNAVAVTQSLGSGFGSAMVVPGTGMTLNNFMNWFDLEPQSPNAIGPCKKKRDVRLAGPGLGPGRPAPAHRHPGEPRNFADHAADDHERSGPQHEHPGRHRSPAPQDRKGVSGGRGDPDSRCRAGGAGAPRPPVQPPGRLVRRGGRRPGHHGRSGLRLLHGRRRSAPRRLRHWLVEKTMSKAVEPSPMEWGQGRPPLPRQYLVRALQNHPEPQQG